MEYLLAMSFSGSTMMGLYLLLKYLLKDKVSARLYDLIIKEAVLFFLIPLPFLKGWYRKVIRAVIPRGQTKGVEIPVAWTRYVVHVGEKTYVNSYGVIQTAVVAVWLLIVCIMMVSIFLRYFRIRRLILKYEVTGMTEEQRSFLAEMKKQYGVRRPVILCKGRNGDRTMTFGVCRPVIICDKEIDSREAEMHVRHEMVHIKRLDVLWKMLARLVLILHWWNPFAWMLAAVLAFTNSMTVFAYRDTMHQEVSENTSQEDVTKSLHNDIITFYPSGADGEILKDFKAWKEKEFLYEKQFTDSEGNIYPCMDEEADTTYESCGHDLVSGTSAEHTKKSDGGCEIKKYYAQRCSKCGYVIQGDEKKGLLIQHARIDDERGSISDGALSVVRE